MDLYKAVEGRLCVGQPPAVGRPGDVPGVKSLSSEGDFALLTAFDVDDPEVAAQLFRIAQEGINNALRHGNAQNIELCYGREGDSAYLEVIDDGIGIPAEHDRVEGLGLKSMRYRTRLINGTLDVAAKARGGTEVRCSFKYSAPEGGPLRAEL